MLEPVMRPRTGRLLWGLVLVLSLALGLMDELVVTRAGTFKVTLAAALIGAIAGVRALGIHLGIRNGSGRMPWAFRILSWALLLAPLTVMGALGTPAAVGLAATLCALDAVGGLMNPKREVGRESARADRLLARLKVPLLLAVGLVGLGLLHWLWASRVEGGLLLDWAYLSLLFAITVRYTILPARRASEEGAQPAPSVRRHVPAARPLADPDRDSALRAVAAYRKSGRVEPLLEFVRSFGVEGLDGEARRFLERAGTTREQDLSDVAALLEKRLSPTPALTRTVRP